MRLHGTAALADLLGNFVAYRKLCPADTRLPSLQTIRPGAPPRKGAPAYAEIVAPILRAARSLSSPAELQRMIVIGDTQRSDLGLFETLRALTGWQGRAFIADEVSGAAPLMRWEGPIAFANAWIAIHAFRAALEADEFVIDAGTVVILDIDKTMLGARGRNHAQIDASRMQALRAAVAATLGTSFEQEVFAHSYKALDQARYHPLTEDNQDYLAYLCVMLCAGVLRLEDTEHMLEQHMHIVGALAIVAERIHRFAAQIQTFHEEISSLIKAGDLTPFKDFRKREFRETLALMRPAEQLQDAMQLVHEQLVLTAEVWEVAKLWQARGALLFGLSDKPDEAAFPTPDDQSLGLEPLHMVPTALVGY